MITNADVKKLKTIFATKGELKALDSKMDLGFVEVIKYIGETRIEIVSLLNNSIEELKDIARRHQMTLENHDSRISHLEYANKS